MAVVNGVFKGGGAKGIAYAGALRACEKSGIQFAAVAGSSAGAITAALVAAGYTSKQIFERMEEGLKAVGSPWLAWSAVTRRSLFGSAQLASWLERELSHAVRGEVSSDSEVTFRELYSQTGIELYVVAMEVSSRQPLVFCESITPEMGVASAVMASSAIPVAFPQAVIESRSRRTRLIDGGTWANYPSFVFEDESFRKYHSMPPTNKRTVGFMLEDAADPFAGGHQLRFSGKTRWRSDSGSAARELGTVGAALSSPITVLAAVIGPTLLVIALLAGIVAQAEAGFPLLSALPENLSTPILVALLASMSVGIPFAALSSLLLLRLGRSVFDAGATGAVAAMGVGPGVPYWTGYDSEHVGVRIPPTPRLGTLSFRPSDSVVEAAIWSGYKATADTVTNAGLGHLSTPSDGDEIHLFAAGSGKTTTDATSFKTAIRGVLDVLTYPSRVRRSGSAKNPVVVLIDGLLSFFNGVVIVLSMLIGVEVVLRTLSNGATSLEVLFLIFVGLVNSWLILFAARNRGRSAANPYRNLARMKSRTLIALSIIAAVIAAIVIWKIPSPFVTAQLQATTGFDGSISRLIEVSLFGRLSFKFFAVCSCAALSARLAAAARWRSHHPVINR